MERDFVLRKRNQSGARDERGAAAVEFALVALILFTLLFGILQLGIWFWSRQTADAAREVSRVAAVSPCASAEITTAGTDAFMGAPAAASADTITVTPPVKSATTSRCRWSSPLTSGSSWLRRHRR